MDTKTALYINTAKKTMAGVLASMKQAWGTQPDVQLHFEPCLVVRADFNIKGFAHKGRRTYVTLKHMTGYRRPEKVVASIAQELLDHRNTCGECGEKTPPVTARMAHAYRILGRDRGWGIENYNPKTGVALYRWYDGKRYVSMRSALTPPDAMERLLYPSRAKFIDKAIAHLEEEGIRARRSRAKKCAVKKAG
jgi:hypothetical protein